MTTLTMIWKKNLEVSRTCVKDERISNGSESRMGRPGAPEQMWLKVVRKPMNTAGIISWNEAAELAKDRES